MSTTSEVVDVLIIGAGLSGIGAAAHLLRECPGKSFAILESHAAIGGTWDLFRYPGVRSDSDMYTFAYSFKPWRGDKAIGDGDSIREYVEETANEYGITERIRFRHRVLSADWSSQSRTWTVAAEHLDTGDLVTFEAGWVIGATGYYDHEAGYRPEFPGEDRFRGRIVHPQEWPEDLDYAGKSIAIIGSGATAVTLVPALAAGGAGHVTMVQRTPTYISSVPERDALAGRLRGRLPEKLTGPVLRWKNALSRQFVYNVSRARPQAVRTKILDAARAALPDGYDVAKDFTPPYDPWDQRVCAVPDGDLFKAIGAGTASIATGRIRTFTEDGIELEDGRRVPADIIVTATGLNLKWLGGIQLSMDGAPVDTAECFAYKGMMLSGVPNFNVVVGYTNNSWTLKADLVNRYVCALLAYMDKHHMATATPGEPFGQTPAPLFDLDAGYVRRGSAGMAKQGTNVPWRLHQDYVLDIGLFNTHRLEDGVMEFGHAPAMVSTTSPAAVDPAGVTEGREDGRPRPPASVAAPDSRAPAPVRFTQVGGGRVRYRDEGMGSPVVMVHGIGRSLEDWDEQFVQLADTGHRLIAVDLPGYGDSAPLQESYSLPALGRFVGEFLDAIGVDSPVHLMGNSLGGAVVMQQAALAPERVASLALVDPAGFGREVAPFIRLMALRPLAKVLMSRPTPESARRIEAAVFHGPEFVTEEQVRLSHRLALRPEADRVFTDTVKALGTVRGMSEEWRTELLSTLRDLRIPTLVVWGVDDEILPVKHLSTAARSLPHAQTHAFATAGHMPQIECAEDFADLAAEFWAEAAAPLPLEYTGAVPR